MRHAPTVVVAAGPSGPSIPAEAEYEGPSTSAAPGGVPPPQPPPGAPPAWAKTPKAIPRVAGGEKWIDTSLGEWPDNDFRIFVGNLGPECNDETLTRAFSKYTSFAKAKTVRDKAARKCKGYICGGGFACGGVLWWLVLLALPPFFSLPY